MHLAGGPETQFHAAFEPRGRQLRGHGMGVSAVWGASLVLKCLQTLGSEGLQLGGAAFLQEVLESLFTSLT